LFVAEYRSSAHCASAGSTPLLLSTIMLPHPPHTPASPLDLYEPLDVIGNGSFGIIRKVRRKVDGTVSRPVATTRTTLTPPDPRVQRAQL
jgi:hypothetical protein